MRFARIAALVALFVSANLSPAQIGWPSPYNFSQPTTAMTSDVGHASTQVPFVANVDPPAELVVQDPAPEPGLPSAPPASAASTPALSAAPACLPACDLHCTCPRFWASGDYLLWWLKGSPLPIPLVTGSPPGTIPFLGDPKTTVLVGEHNIDFGAFSGGRVNIGMWLDRRQTVGLEVSGFLLDKQVSHQNFPTSLTGPNIGIPFIGQGTGTGLIVAVNGTNVGSAGVLAVTTTSQLWGAEANALYNLSRNGAWDISLLGGFRYLGLDEALQLTTQGVNEENGAATTTDRFHTTNEFYGGQIGARFSWTREALSIDFGVKVALGDNSGSSDIQGSRTATNIGRPAELPFGILAQPTNIGQLTKNSFAVVPEAELKVSYSLSPHVKLSVGYDYLFWSEVLRPGNQIDPVLNLPFSSGSFFVPAVTTGHPLQPLKESDFWAQGITFGLAFRF